MTNTWKELLTEYVNSYATSNDHKMYAREFYKDIEKLIETEIANAVSEREKEIVETVEKQENNHFCDTHELCEGCCSMHCCGIGYDNSKNDIISLIK